MVIDGLACRKVSISVEQINDGDIFVVEVIPEGVSAQLVVDLHFLDSHDGHLNSLHEQNFFFFGVRAVQ